MRLAGLNIEGDTVRTAVLNRLPGRTRQVRTADFALEAGDEASRTSGLRSILEHLRDEDGVRAVVAGIGITQFSYHFISLPLTKRQDILHALGFELEKYLPLPPDEYFYDFITLARDEGSTSMLVFAALKSRLAWITNAAEQTGITLAGIRCAPMEALGEFVSGAGSADRMGFIYRGHDAMSIFSLSDSAPADLKVVRNSDPMAAGISGASLSETSRVFSAGEPGAPERQETASSELNYSLPLLLAQSAIRRKRRLDLQLASGTDRGSAPLWQEQAPAVLGALCAFIIVLTTLLAYYKDSSALRRLDTELKELQQLSSSLLEVRDETNAMNSKIRYLEEYRASMNGHIRALREMSVRLPASAWLTSMSFDAQGKVQIQGYAARASEIIKPLDSSDLFRNVEFSSPVTISKGQERFSIRMELER